MYGLRLSLLVKCDFNVLFCAVHCFPLFADTESISKSGKPNTHNVQFLNLSYISNVQLINEAPDMQPPPLPNLNYNKVSAYLIIILLFLLYSR